MVGEVGLILAMFRSRLFTLLGPFVCVCFECVVTLGYSACICRPRVLPTKNQKPPPSEYSRNNSNSIDSSMVLAACKVTRDRPWYGFNNRWLVGQMPTGIDVLAHMIHQRVLQDSCTSRDVTLSSWSPTYLPLVKNSRSQFCRRSLANKL